MKDSQRGWIGGLIFILILISVPVWYFTRAESTVEGQTVDTPWDQVPDLVEYNEKAYRRLNRSLNNLHRPAENPAPGDIPVANQSSGVLMLGEAGTGKTHLVQAVARALREAVEPDPRKGDAIPSTKGAL